MSTQSSASIPFSFAHAQVPVRLIELPPALLSLLSNTDSPPTLKIKASTSATAVHSTDNHAVLCTPTQTYSLRQVYSSNSILLVQPSPPLPTEGDNEDGDTLVPSIGLKAVSTAVSYIELIPTIHDAESLLLKHIPVYHSSPTPAPAKTALLDALPISDAEFHAAWNSLSCFSCAEGLSHRPSPAAVLAALGEIFSCAAAAGTASFSLSSFETAGLVRLLQEDHDGEAELLPVGLVEAAVGSVCEQRTEEATGRWCLDAKKCAAYIGRALLQEWLGREGGKGDMLYVSFMSRWKASVPEECVGECKLEGIKGWYVHPTANTIRFVGGGGAVEGKGVQGGEEGKKVQEPVKNKWHERFGKGKRR